MGAITIILFCIITLSTTYWINKKYIPELSNFTLPILFLAKLCFAYLFYYIYTYHYGSGVLSLDASVYFNDSKALYDVYFQSKKDFFTLFFGLNENPEFLNHYLGDTTHWITLEPKIFNDTRNIIRVNTLFHFISNHTVFAHFIGISFLSFYGIIEVFQWVKKKSSLPPLLLIILLTLAPSLVFWSSNILKEPLLILGMGLLLRGCFGQLSPTHRVWRIGLGLTISLLFKPYILLSFLVALAFYFFSKIYKKQWVNVIVFGLSGVLILWITGLSTPITNVISDKQYDFINVREGGLYVEADEQHFYYIKYEDLDHFKINDNNTATLKHPVNGFLMLKTSNYKRSPILLDSVGESYPVYLRMEEAKSKVNVTLIHYNYWQLIRNTPEALINSFLEPLPKKGQSKLMYLSFFENVGYLLLLSSLLIFPKTTSNQENRVLLTLAWFMIFIALITGWTTPIAGAIVRYMIPAKLILLIIFAMKIDFKRLQTKLPVRKMK